MSQHRTATLQVAFLDYHLRNSPTGQYYVFNVLAQGEERERDVCRMDSIHRSTVSWLFDALDRGDSVIAPVVRDVRGFGYRIDLLAIREHAESRRVANATRKKHEAPNAADRRRIRVQFNVDSEKLQQIEEAAKADGYSNHSDWLRAVVDKALKSQVGGI